MCDSKNLLEIKRLENKVKEALECIGYTLDMLDNNNDAHTDRDQTHSGKIRKIMEGNQNENL